MALWFVWAFDLRNGYEVLLHRGGVSVAISIGARVAAIVALGALGRLFHAEDDASRSILYRHAWRYYPLVRSVVSAGLMIVAAVLLLKVWGLDLTGVFYTGGIGHRLASALLTIAVAGLFALFAWEAINILFEHRLDQWTAQGDLARAVRLRTLLPILRTSLFVVIALIVVLTGLSELGVNITPMLAGASIFGVALGFGSQKLVQDFITGIFLLMENAMQVGDWVTVAGVSGTVEHLSIRTVRLRGGDGSLYTVPFSSVSTVNNTNRGIGNAAVKVNVAVRRERGGRGGDAQGDRRGPAQGSNVRQRHPVGFQFLGCRPGRRGHGDADRTDPVQRQRTLAGAARVQPADPGAVPAARNPDRQSAAQCSRAGWRRGAAEPEPCRFPGMHHDPARSRVAADARGDSGCRRTVHQRAGTSGRAAEDLRRRDGSLFAAVGTALPETMVPILALTTGTASRTVSEEIGVGAILGAPLMLATLSTFLMTLAVLRQRKLGGRVRPSAAASSAT